MNKYEIVSAIERFAPPETAEKWDCSGWIVETSGVDVNRVMLALTVTDDVVDQAKSENCDMIISHHPLFQVPLDYKDVDIYCAHTNLDLAKGGTTDTLIDKLKAAGLTAVGCEASPLSFVRYVDTNITVKEFLKILSKVSPALRYTNPQNIKRLSKIAFCSGSGTEFITEAAQSGAEALVTGDLKFHTALESPIMVCDIGHFESEIQVLSVFKKLISDDVEVIFAKEESPFKTLSDNRQEFSSR